MSRRNLMFAILALGLVGAAAWWFMVRPKEAAHLANLQQQLTTARTVQRSHAQQQRTANTQLASLQAKVAKLQQQQDAYTRAVPNTLALTALMQDLNHLTDQNALKYDGLQEKSKTQLIPGLYQVDYTLNTTGRFIDQVHFLADLQHLQRRVVVTSVSMTAQAKDPRQPMVRTDISFQTFVRGDLPQKNAKKQ